MYNQWNKCDENTIKDAYEFALQLMDVLFTKEELAFSLIFHPGLDPQKVQQLLNFVDKWYADNWDLKTLTTKANQKCRDSKLNK